MYRTTINKNTRKCSGKINENKTYGKLMKKELKIGEEATRKKKKIAGRLPSERRKFYCTSTSGCRLLLRRIMCHMRKKILRESRASFWHAQIPATHEGVLEAIAVVVRLVVFLIARVFVLIGLGKARGGWVECLGLRTPLATSRLLDLHGGRRHATLAVISSKMTF